MGIEKIVLIDGEEVARLMIEYDLGVSRIASYDVKKIDSDYFTE
jgi:restriction system protein